MFSFRLLFLANRASYGNILSTIAFKRSLLTNSSRNFVKKTTNLRLFQLFCFKRFTSFKQTFCKLNKFASCSRPIAHYSLLLPLSIHADDTKKLFSTPQKPLTQPHIPTVSALVTNHLKNDYLLLAFIVVLSIFAAILNILTPVYIGYIVDDIQKSFTLNSSVFLKITSLKLFALFVLQGFITFLNISFVSRLGEHLAKGLKIELYSSLIRKDVAFFDINMQNEIIGRLSVDVQDFKHTFKLVITQGLKCFTQVIGAAIHLHSISSPLTFAILSTMPFLYISMNFYGAYLRELSKFARIDDSEASSIASEVISNIRTVRAFAAEDMELDKYSNSTERALNTNNHLGFHIGLFQGITNTSIGCLTLIILYYGGTLVSQDRMTAGQLMTYLAATQQAQKSLSMIGSLFGQVLKSISSASRVFEYINVRSTIPFSTGIELKQLIGNIEFRNIEFVYPSRPDHNVLHGFNLKVPVGGVVALCGLSGSGKSTVGQLLERFYEPQNGEILIDGIPLNDINPRWLRRQVGYINQEPSLFATSILENIRYGNENAPMHLVKLAAQRANAAEFIESFPDGYNTLVGERGVTLSGGQKQRLAIARALLMDPKILILDEATSALDSQSEKLVQDALDTLMEGRTVLVIAHRLSTIKNADLIVVMSGKGKDERGTNIVEQGSHHELLRKKGAYYNLYNSPMI